MADISIFFFRCIYSSYWNSLNSFLICEVLRMKLQKLTFRLEVHIWSTSISGLRQSLKFSFGGDSLKFWIIFLYFILFFRYLWFIVTHHVSNFKRYWTIFLRSTFISFWRWTSLDGQYSRDPNALKLHWISHILQIKTLSLMAHCVSANFVLFCKMSHFWFRFRFSDFFLAFIESIDICSD